MGYDETSKLATMKYIKDKQQEIKVRYKKEEYEQEILPVIEKKGVPVATYIKQAVSDKIKSDSDDTDFLKGVKNVIVTKLPGVFKTDCREIILYGSYARGDYTEDSDVDIAVLTDSDREQVKKYGSKIDEVASQISYDYNALVNIVCLPFAEYEEKKSWYPYFMNIAKEGVLLYER